MVTSNVINGLIDNSKNNGNISSTTKNDKSNSSLDVNDFLQLLVAQMQYQDPLEPTDNSQYIAQMATFSQVEATKEMLDTATRQTASNLVGKTVIMTTDLNKDGYIAGKVDYWEVISNKIYLGIDGKLYDIDDLDTVMDDDYYKKWNKNDSTTDTSNKSDSSSSDTSSDKSDTTGKTEQFKEELRK